MKIRKMKLGVMFVIMMLVASIGYADSIGSWDVDKARNGRAKGTTFVQGITIKHMLINGLTTTKTGMGAYGWTTGNTPSTTQYYDFDVNVNNNVNYIATNLTLGFSGDVGSWELRSSVDNYMTVLSVLSDASNGTYIMDFNNFKLTNNTTFRLYGYGNTTLSGISGISENVTLNGMAVPEPKSITLIIVIGLVILWVVKIFVM